MKNIKYISECCEEPIFFKGSGKGLWCKGCKKEVFSYKDIRLKTKQMNTTTHKQLKSFLETTEAKLDTTDLSKCIAYLYDENSGEVASSDFINEKHLCDGIVYINEEKHKLSDNQIDLLFEHFHEILAEDLRTWNDIKNDTYNVRDDQY